MSRSNSPGNKNIKHKGLMTSLFNKQNPSYGINYKATQPQIQNKIYVHTIAQKTIPNAHPYMQSEYINQSSFNVNEASSQYIPSANDIFLHQNHLASRTQQNDQNINRNNYHIRFVQPQESSASYHYQEASRSNRKGSANQNTINLSKSKFVPVPPEKFLVQNNMNYSTSPPPYQTIINQNRTVLPSPPPTVIQNVKKTFVPHHIYNQIPVVYQTPTHVQPKKQIHQVQSPQNDQSQQVLLGYYEKVYKKYQQQKHKNIQLMKKITQMENQLNQRNKNTLFEPNTIVKQIVKEHHKKIDRNKIQKMFASKFETALFNVQNKRTANCLIRIGDQVFRNFQSKIRQMSNVKVQQISYTILNTMRSS